MLDQSEVLVIPDNAINMVGCVLLLGIILLITIITFVILLELNKASIRELRKYRQEIEAKKRKIRKN